MNIACAFFLLLACFSMTGAQDRIDTLKIYDRADNLLYYLTYDYGADSILIGQSLYDRTGYFLKVISLDNSGKQSFKDDNGDLHHYSLSHKDSTRSYFDLFDHFNKPLEQRVYQGFYSPGALEGVVEFFNLSGGLTHQMRYIFDCGRIARINLLDNAGVLSNHVDAHYMNQPISIWTRIARIWKNPPGRFSDVSPQLLFDVLYAYQELPGLTRSPYISPTSLAPSLNGRKLYVAGATGRMVMEVDISSGLGTVSRTLMLPKEPTGLVVSPDGNSIYVTCASELRPDGEVFVVSTAGFTLERSFSAGHSARSPIIGPDNRTLYICNQFKNLVSIYNALTGALVDTVHVIREPFSAAITPDGTRLLVTNFLPLARTRHEDSVACGIVTFINTAARSVEANVELTSGAQSLAGICVSKDGKYAYVSHILSMFNMTPLRHKRGNWTNMNAVSVVDILNKCNVDVMTLDRENAGAADPWAVSCDSHVLCIVTAGSQAIHVMKLDSLHQALSMTEQPRNLSKNLTFARKFTRQRKLTVKGPQSITIIGRRAYIGGYFSDSLEVVDIAYIDTKLLGCFPLGPPKAWDKLRSGEFYFSDATRMGIEQWQSCVSCHPFGRMDGLKWDLNNDGSGNFKNAKSLLYAHITPPVMWTGVRDSAELAVRAGVANILMTNPASVQTETSDIDAYLKSKRHVPSPFLEHGRLNAAAKRGKDVFAKMQCNTCHVPENYYTDMKLYAGLKSENDFGPRDGSWDTPTLIETWRTAPYMHDGRFLDMKELFSGETGHEIFQSITTQELDDLLVFLKSL